MAQSPQAGNRYVSTVTYKSSLGDPTKILHSFFNDPSIYWWTQDWHKRGHPVLTKALGIPHPSPINREVALKRSSRAPPCGKGIGERGPPSRPVHSEVYLLWPLQALLLLATAFSRTSALGLASCRGGPEIQLSWGQLVGRPNAEVTWGSWGVRVQAGVLGIFKGEDHLDVAPVAWDAQQLPVRRGPWKRKRRGWLEALPPSSRPRGN